MRKLQLISLYAIVLLVLYHTPEPENLTQIETYEAKMRKTQQLQPVEKFSFTSFPTHKDTIAFTRPNP